MTRQDWNPPTRRRPRGGLLFAGALLLPIGAWQVIIGSAVAAGEAFVFSGSGYWYRADSTAWGWINLVIGIAAVAVGLALVGATGRRGHLRGRVVLTLVIAVVSAMNQLFLAPRYPLWATLVIVLDVFVIWAVTTQVDGVGKDAGDADDGIVRLVARPAPSWHRGIHGP